MTQEQAKQLVPEKSYIRFAGGRYKVADLSNQFGAMFIGIYDEPPSLHVDYLNANNVEVDESASNGEGKEDESQKWIGGLQGEEIKPFESVTTAGDLPGGLSAEEILSKFGWHGFDKSRIEKDCLEAMSQYASSLVTQREEEIERRTEIIKKLFRGGMKLTIGMWEDTNPEEEWQQFKKENNL